ncbi:hypothetical protein A2160_04805 [Candidatus Beckwithbacteria bacterium RBG_13_42_9]|uniref:Uncharacterized protein n=1 Tax=Candidatus Beckwithbacteria bacterium RBG_13_42_9 TaxID=1797457 RepID=A0A1F5E5S2_9BACT|nr:MAG: hypothetical protein A2160_04805 [Candidatus Beckwithbacteria bacterium RBG_13_42_9]
MSDPELDEARVKFQAIALTASERPTIDKVAEGWRAFGQWEEASVPGLRGIPGLEAQSLGAEVIAFTMEQGKPVVCSGDTLPTTVCLEASTIITATEDGTTIYGPLLEGLYIPQVAVVRHFCRTMLQRAQQGWKW